MQIEQIITYSNYIYTTCTFCRSNYYRYSTVNSQYLELGYLDFCEAQSVYMNQKYILIAFSNHNLALGTFLQVQITRSTN